MAVIEILPSASRSNIPKGIERDFRGHFKKKAIRAAVRRAIASRYGCGPGETVSATCQYCESVGTITWFLPHRGNGGHISLDGLEFDHIIPEILGGSGEPENLVLACRKCNRSKGFKS